MSQIEGCSVVEEEVIARFQTFKSVEYSVSCVLQKLTEFTDCFIVIPFKSKALEDDLFQNFYKEEEGRLGSVISKLKHIENRFYSDEGSRVLFYFIF